MVAVDDGEMELFCIKDPGSLPYWTSQCASFSREHGPSFASVCPEIANHIELIRVKVRAVNTLFARGRSNIDVLMIDVEGFDYELLRAIDPTSLLDLVCFEYVYMSSVQWDAIQRVLKFVDFTSWVVGRDVIAFCPRTAETKSV
jgi:hypothetical protein